MIIKPLIRSNICLNAHPVGCGKEVKNQINYVRAQAQKRSTPAEKPKTVLVLGCSTGYGLASRITAAFEFGANTIGVSFEKEGTEVKSGTPGWYTNMAFDRAATGAGLKTITLNGDAFSNAMREKVIDAIKEMGGSFDLIIYSLASPVRTDPVTGELYRSVLKPLGESYVGNSFDIASGKLCTITAEGANAEEARQTVKVMGGEDWELWISQLSDAGVLSKGCKTVAYSYIGPDLSHAIYRDGTIGGAKKHLEQTSNKLNVLLQQKVGGEAFVSINKGLVTRSSGVIPVIPLYLSLLFKIMKAKGTHEGCIEQMDRLFAERLYTDGPVPVDEKRLIRIDELEMDLEVQNEVARLMPSVTEENLGKLGDLEGYRHDFLAINGFDVKGVDYAADVPRMDTI